MQEHIGRLPVAYYDANKTGNLVSRIMTDVEGMRNLIGTGLVEFAGGVTDRAHRAVILMLRISPVMTGMTVGFLRDLRLCNPQSLRHSPPDLPRAWQDQRARLRAV